MDLDGVRQLCFPSFPEIRRPTVFLGAERQAARRAVVAAYNDFIIDEWCAPSRPTLPVDPLDPVATVGRTARGEGDPAARRQGRRAIRSRRIPSPSASRRPHRSLRSALKPRRRRGCLSACTSAAPGRRRRHRPTPFAVTIALFGCN